jgi:betaine-aldehyde dehydrogenase
MAIEERLMWIGGEFRPATSGEWIDTLDPSTGRMIARVPNGGSQDVHEAVEAGQRAQLEWSRLEPLHRGRLLHALADRVRDACEDLARLDALDSGNPITAMRRDVRIGAQYLDYFAGLVTEAKGETIPATAANIHFTLREPFGVVGRIIPYNHPIMFACEKIAAPLAAGNAVILKPAEQTPLSALLLTEIVSDLFPAGLLNVVTGDGSTGAEIVAHPQVHRVAFTGAAATGRAVMRGSADGLKDLSLELGGKNPFIICPDADLERAIEASITAMNFHISAGQSCGATSRILVHESIHSQFLDGFCEQVQAIRLGPAVDERTEMGPLISAGHRDRVLGYIQAGLDEGARLVSGGRRPDQESLSSGYFVVPTVFDEVSTKMKIAQDEIFGPVVSILIWRTEEDVLESANSVEYGLTANIWSSDLATAYRLMSQVEAGYVWVNGDGRHYVGTPFGGYKSSGLGSEESLDELLSYTRTKTVHMILE